MLVNNHQNVVALASVVALANAVALASVVEPESIIIRGDNRELIKNNKHYIYQNTLSKSRIPTI